MSGPGYEEGGEAEWPVREVGGPQPGLVIPSLPGGNHTSASGPGFSLVAHPSRSQPIIWLGGIGVTEVTLATTTAYAYPQLENCNKTIYEIFRIEN